MVGALSKHQHVLIDFATGALDVAVGLLAGLSLADVSFALAISRVSMKVRNALGEAGYGTHVDMTSAVQMFGCPEYFVPCEDVHLSETSIVDDVAYPIISSAETPRGGLRLRPA